MAPLTARLLSSLEEVIDQIPDQTQSFRSQTQGQIRKRSKKRTVFRKFLAKLSGDDKNDQIAFLINQAQKISRRTYVKVALHLQITPLFKKEAEKPMLIFTSLLMRSYLSLPAQPRSSAK